MQRLWLVWSRYLGDADGHNLELRLRRSGWDPNGVRALLAGGSCTANAADWAPLLFELYDGCANISRGCTTPLLPIHAERVPFEELLIPLVGVAHERLRRRFPPRPGQSPHGGIGNDAYRTLERALLTQLANITGLALLNEFDAECVTPRRLLIRLAGRAPGEPPRDAYAAFVTRHLRSGWRELFSRYPVMLRLLALAIEKWVEACAELMTRLQDDWPELLVDPVVALSPSLSDPHNGNRMVVSLQFASGLRTVYKPKDLRLDAAYQDFLNWCNTRGMEPRQRTLSVRACEGYGWCEHVEQRPCEDEEAAHRYYQRAGSLLAVLYLLQATDCHRENLIAHGEHPVLIDAETLLYPPPETAIAEQRYDGSWKELSHFLGSVIGTGMLPRWDVNTKTNIAFDVSALGCMAPPPTPVPVSRICDANTDDMRVVNQHHLQPLEKNVPRLGERLLPPDRYIGDICEGFSSAYALFQRHKDELVSEQGPLRRFKGLEARYLIRNTRVYNYLLAESFHPDALRLGSLRSIGFDRLAADADSLLARERWPVLQWELDALEDLDVPHFTRKTDGRDLYAKGGRVAGRFFGRSGFDRVTAVAKALSECDLAHQLAIIQGCLLARDAVETHDPVPLRASPERGSSTVEALSREQMTEEAARLGEELLSKAYRRPDGRCTWLGFAYVDAVKRLQLQPIGENLYEGKAGVAVFLAALARITGESRFRDGALDALVSVRELHLALRAHGPSLTSPASMGIGGLGGVSSLVYALTTSADLLHDDELLRDAAATARLITPEAIAADRQLDVLGGTAGALLCLLRLQSSLPGSDLLPLARRCGEHLLERCCTTQPRSAARRVDVGRALTGFSHGAAGIAWALAKLYEFSGERRYLEGVHSAHQFERENFCPEAGNWLDLRAPATPGGARHFMTSWCHGAPGIGLARIACRRIIEGEDLDQDIAVATRTSANHGLDDVDHVCCGNFGRFELLGVTPTRSRADERVLHYAIARVVHAARHRGGYRLFYNLPRGAWNPGFFRGVAGIGYGLLRHAVPGVLPNITILE